MAIGAVVFALLASVGWWWLLRTTGGLGFALHQGAALAGVEFEAAELEGSLAGGFELHGLEVRVDGTRVSAERLAMRPRLWQLLSGRIEVDALRVDRARLSFGASADKTADQAGWRPGRLEMPVDFVLRNIELVDIAIDRGEAPPFVFSVAATGISLIAGRVEVEGLALRQGELALTASAAVDSFDEWSGEVEGAGTLSLPAVVHRGTLALHGDVEALELEAALSGGGEVRIDLALGTPLAVPTVYGQLSVVDLDLATVMSEPPVRRLDLSLAIGYSDEHMALYGPIRVDGREFKLVAGGLGIAAGRLKIGRLALSSDAAGSIAVAGEWPLSAEAGLGALLIDLDEAWLGDWRSAPPPDPVRASGRLAFTGTAQTWWLAGGGEVAQGEARGRFAADLEGTPELLTIRSGSLGLADSTLGFKGRVGLGDPLTAALDLELDDFETTPYLPDWPGRVAGTASVQLRATDPARWSVEALDLSGTLREAAFSLSGGLEGIGPHPEKGSLVLAWGESRVDLAVLARDRIEAQLSAIDLARIGPVGEGGWTGRIDGRVALALDRDPVESLRADLEFADVTLAGLVVGRMTLAKSDDYTLAMSGAGLEAGGITWSRWRLDTSGTPDALVVRVNADAGRLALAADVSGALLEQGWRGRVETLELRPDTGDALTLEAPAELAIDAGSWRLGDLCLRLGEGRACLSGEGAGAAMRLALSTEAFALASLRPLLPADAPQIDGVLSGGGEWRIDAEGAAAGGMRLDLVDGRLRGLVEGADEIAFAAQIEADAAAESIVATVELPGHGRMQALLVGFDDRVVDLELDFSDLGFVDGLSAEVHGVDGTLSGRLSLPLDDPMSGNGLLRASGIGFELPALGLVAREGSATVEIPGTGELVIEAGFGLAPGRIELTARLPFDGSGLEARIRGDNAGLVALPAVRLAGDMDFLLSQVDGVYAIEGGILLREGKIDLDRFAPTVPPSEDVVIEDAPPPPPPLPIRADVSIAMIQAVNLAGFGLEATLNGGVRVTQRPGQAPTARGEMIVKGVFESYGQKLAIERGRLGFSGAPDNPSLDLLAAKRVDRQRVGVQVRGNAKRLVARLYSDPALDQSETLSYLVLGRPLLSASGAEAEQLGEYASALEAAGGSLLAGSLGKRLGLSAGVESFGAAVGSALVVGKYISPRFFIGFGTSLVDSTQIAVLRFRITENIDAEALSAQEQRVSVNWRRER
jgi:translocation and assembly module TamB